MNKRVLLMPSWYPSKKDPHIGVYFREQALLLQQHGVDYRLLLVQKEVSSFFRQLWWMVAAIIQPHVAIKPVDADEPFEGLVIEDRSPQWLADKWKIKLLGRYHRKAWQMLLAGGWHPQLIHAQSAIDAGIYAMMLNWLYKIPYVIIEHQTLHLYYLSDIKRNYIYSAWQRAAKLAVVSEYQKRSLLLHEPGVNPTVIPNWIDENFFIPASDKRAETFHIVNIAYPSPLKDNETLFRALSMLKVAELDFRYTVVGSSSLSGLSKEEQQSLSIIAEKYGLATHGSILPFASREEIKSLLHSAHAYVCTSISETFGVAPREAMAAGVPVIATACGGVEDGMNKYCGIIVPLKSAATIAKKLAAMMNEEIQFDAEEVRTQVVNHCGTAVFASLMKSFYLI